MQSLTYDCIEEIWSISCTYYLITLLLETEELVSEDLCQFVIAMYDESDRLGNMHKVTSAVCRFCWILVLLVPKTVCILVMYCGICSHPLMY